MSTLTDFLLARIAEDEDAAREALAPGLSGEAQPWMLSADSTTEDGLTGLVLVNPARVLAECEAKRRIVERYRKSGHPALYLALADFSLAHADHPDYQQEWKP